MDDGAQTNQKNSYPVFDDDRPPPVPSSARPPKPLAHQPFHGNKKTPPIPPLKPKLPLPNQGENYEVPWDLLHKQRKEYDCEEEEEEDLAGGWYESVGVDDLEEMNRNPPPIWRSSQAVRASPPPLPKSNPLPYKSTKPSERKNYEPKVPKFNNKLNKSFHSLRPKAEIPEDSQDGGSVSGSLQRHSHPVSKPFPPVKPKVMATKLLPGAAEVGANLKNDPKFNRKLQERKQEVYDSTEIRVSYGSPTSGEDVPLGKYEEITFPSKEPPSSIRPQRPVTNAKDPPLVTMIENEEGYIDARQAQDYLSFESSTDRQRSRSPVDLSQLLADPPIPPRDNSPSPPLPPRGPISKPKLKKPLPRGQPKKEYSPSPTSPPPLPSRNLINPAAQTRIKSGDNPPVPKRQQKQVAVEDDDDEDTPPPVPRRHPQASGKHTPENKKAQSPKRVLSPENIDKNPLPLPPRRHSFVDEDDSPPSLSPPVPPPRASVSPVPSEDAPPVPQRSMTQLKRRITDHSHKSTSPPPIPTRRVSADSGLPQSDTAAESQELPAPKQPLKAPRNAFIARSKSSEPEIGSHQQNPKKPPCPPPKPFPKPSRDSDVDIFETVTFGATTPVDHQNTDDIHSHQKPKLNGHAHKSKPPLPTPKKPPAVFPRNNRINKNSPSSSPDHAGLGKPIIKPKPLPHPKPHKT